MLHRHPGHAEAVARVSWCVDQHAIGVITGEVGAGKTVAIRGCDNGIGSGAAHDSRIRAASPAMLHSPPRPGPSRSSARSLHSVARHFVTIRHYGADNSGIDPTSVRDWITSGNDRLAMRAKSSHTRIGVRCPVWTATQQNRTNVRYVLCGWFAYCGRRVPLGAEDCTWKGAPPMSTMEQAHPHQLWPRAGAVLAAAALAVAMTVSSAVTTAAADSVTTTIPVGSQPDAVAVTPDGKQAYIVASESVSVVDTATNTVAMTITTGSGPSGVAIARNGKYAYVTNYHGNSVSVIDTATNAVTETITLPTDTQPFGVAVTPNGKYAYVTNQANNTVLAIDTATRTVTHTITVGESPYGIAITSDGKYAYVTNNIDNSVSVIDTGTNTVTKTIAVGKLPAGVAITPDGLYAYVTNYEGRSVSVITIATNTRARTISVDSAPRAVAITPDGRRAYIPNSTLDGTVTVVDTATNTVTGTIPVGTAPTGVAITPDGRYMYVTNNRGSSVSVIAIDQAPTLSGTPSSGVLNQDYNYAFGVTGHPAPAVKITSGVLPDGLGLSEAGVLSGSPTKSGRFVFTVTASNGFGTDARLPVVVNIADGTMTTPPTTDPSPPSVGGGSLGSFGS